MKRIFITLIFIAVSLSNVISQVKIENKVYTTKYSSVLLTNLQDRVHIRLKHNKIKYDFLDRADLVIKFYDCNETLVGENKKTKLLKLTNKMACIYDGKSIREIYDFINSDKGYIEFYIPTTKNKYVKIKVDNNE